MNIGPTQATVPVFTYLRAWEKHALEIRDAIERVLNSGTLILGPEVVAFEREFAEFVGAGASIGVSNGTDALIVALRALEIGAGHEVITVANGPVPTVAAIRAVGAVPRFVDVDSSNLQMNPASLRDAIGPQTRCIIPVHLYGCPAPIEEIVEIANSHKIPVIEDCAQAHGTYLNGRHVGTFGAIGCFSFYPTKNLGAFGDGGMCVVRDSVLASRVRQIARYGFLEDRIAHCDGLNCRLDELQAAILRVRLRHLSADLQLRRNVAERYTAELDGCGFTLPSFPHNGIHPWHLYVVPGSNREQWMDRMTSRGIQTGIHYQHPVHLMPAYAWLGHKEGDLPITERACHDVISLPMFPELTDDEVQRVISAVRKASS